MRKVTFFSFSILIAGFLALTPVLATPAPQVVITPKRTNAVYMFNRKEKTGIQMLVLSEAYKDRVINDPTSTFEGGERTNFDVTPFNNRVNRCSYLISADQYYNPVYVFKHNVSQARFYVTKYEMNEMGVALTDENGNFVKNEDFIRMKNDSVTYKNKGIRFCGVSLYMEDPSTAAKEVVPVYELITNMAETGQTTIRKAIYTTSIEERDAILAPTPNAWLDNGIAFYALAN